MTRLILILTFATLTTPTAFAHDLKAIVMVDATQLVVQGSYDGYEPADAAQVTVSTTAGAEIARGVLNNRGSWSMPRPESGKYNVVVEQAGHRTNVVISLQGTTEVNATPDRLEKPIGAALGIAILLAVTFGVRYLRNRSLRRRSGQPGM